jgi:copper(I)-binding protein
MKRQNRRQQMQIRKLTFATIACAAALASFFGMPLRAEEVKAGDLVITQAWARATPKGAKPAVAISPSRTTEPRRTG